MATEPTSSTTPTPTPTPTRRPPPGEEEEESSSKAWNAFIAGNVGGIFGLTVAFPFDTLKMRAMVEPEAYPSMGVSLRKMIGEEGVLSLYRGLLAPVVGYGAINAVAFGSYEWGKEVLRGGGDPEADPMWTVVVPAAGFAGMVQSFIRSPVELAKSVQQSWRNADNPRAAPFRSSFHSIAHVVSTEGVSGLFRGLSATIAREVPQYAIYYPTYAVVRPALESASPDSLRPVAVASAGAVAGVAQWIPTISVDVIKSRMQGAPPGTYSSFVGCARALWAEGGLPIFFKGTAPALVRAIPLHAGVFLGYDTTMRVLDRTTRTTS